MTRGRIPSWLNGITVLGLLSVACTRVKAHIELPDLAAEDASFLPTIEAYTSTARGGNRATVLLNGDQIFPAQPAAIRAARTSISYAQHFYEEGTIGREIADALPSVAAPESVPTSCLTASGPSRCRRPIARRRRRGARSRRSGR